MDSDAPFRIVTRCAACGYPLRSDNESETCGTCQQKHLSRYRCACGCGQPVDARNLSGIRRECLPRYASLRRR